MFNFDQAIKEGADLRKGGLLTACILGQQGGGKSRLIGTLGVKTLYLYALGEAHGPDSAAVAPGSLVVPMCFDHENGQPLGPDTAFARLMSILGAVDEIKKAGFKAIAIDSATELEAIVRDSNQFKNACKTKDGGHNTFAESPTTISMLRQIMSTLLQTQRLLKLHVVVTCALDVKDRAADGEISEASPRLLGYGVAESFVRMFYDVLVVGEIERGGSVKHKLQFGSDISKVSTDLKTKQIKKMLNLRPRVTGVEDVPGLVDADLKEIIKLKGGK
jgi:hypothetical protein